LDFKKWGGSGLGALYKFTPMVLGAFYAVHARKQIQPTIFYG